MRQPLAFELSLALRTPGLPVAPAALDEGSDFFYIDCKTKKLRRKLAAAEPIN